VWLTDSSGNVFFCRTFNFSNMMPSAGPTPETAQFTTPAGLANGTYNLFVSAVGVQSKNPFPFTVGVGGTSDGGVTVGADAGAGADAGHAGDGGSSDATAGSSSSSSGGSTGNSGSGSTGGSGSSGNGSTTGNGSTGGASGGSSTGGQGSGGDHAGCSCRTAGDAPGTTGWAATLALAIAGVAGGRRRSRRAR